MKIKTKGIILNGNPIGSTVTVADADGGRLIKQGLAEKVVEKGTSEPKKTPTKRKQPVKKKAEPKDKK